MKEKEGVGFRIIIMVLAVVFVFGIFALHGVYEKEGIEPRLKIDKEKQTLSFYGDDDIKILQLTDTQLLKIDEAGSVMETVRKTVKKAAPDLIVLTGDNISDNTGVSLFLCLVKGMEQFEIPWAPVLGNHDYRSLVTPQRQSKIYESAKFCLFKKGNVADSYGNYAYTIKRNETSVYSFLFMDSGRDFRDEHVEWYENTVQALSVVNGAALPNWVFFHIPTEETQLAYERSLETTQPLDGEVNEKICIQSRNVGFFEAAKRGGATALIYGHDHVNTMIADYQGVKLCYGVKSGKTSYYENRLQGGNLFRLKKDNTFTIERIFI